MRDIFPVGAITNPVLLKKKCSSQYRQVTVSVPARINNLILDTKTLVHPKKEKVYHAGEFTFSVNVNTYAKLAVVADGKRRVVVSSSHRPSLVRHAALLMQKSLNVDDSFRIEANNEFDYPHAGFGSSSSLITAVAIAINEAYGNPLDQRKLSLLVAQNHGEEIAGSPDKILHVQCNGASPLAALYGGGMQLIAGEAQVVVREPIPEKYSFVFGIPKSYKKRDALYLMELEERTFPEMVDRSIDHSQEIAWRVVHELLPAMKEADMKAIGDLLEFYRFETGSLASDSLAWPELMRLMSSLRPMRKGPFKIISTSSCGPLIFAVSTDQEAAVSLFRKHGMKTFVVTPNNTGYRVLERS